MAKIEFPKGTFITEVEVNSEIVTDSDNANIVLLDNGKILAKLEATIERRQGADGGYYPVVELRQVQ